MAIFSHDFRQSVGVATNSPCWSLKTTDTAKVLELKVVIGSATASEFSLGIASAAGTQSSSATGLSLADMTTTSSSTLAVTWSGAPTAPAKYIEGVCFPATVGSMVYWTWPDGGLIVPANQELVLWNTGSGTNAAIVHYAVKFEEL